MKSTFRKSRWSSEATSTTLSRVTTEIVSAMTAEQLEAYVMHIRIQEITQKLDLNNIIPADSHRRSPSPEPLYNSAGQRINTRYRRCRNCLEEERQRLVHDAQRLIPNYHPPHGFYIPSRDFPEVNFIGQLLGPRGRSLTDMNKQSGAKIVIRGRGPVKESRGRGGALKFSCPAHNQEDEPLHCLVTADTQEKVDKAKKLVQTVIDTAVGTPDDANDRKREQLRDLAIANVTFRDDEGVTGTDLKIPLGNPPSIEIVCASCNNGDHIACDCQGRRKSAAGQQRSN
ncbi:hypothetical protein BX600DRAFT_480759 [Xylariales sp. PMI_506]|nr:hypothetical protein BX600DRAFT_480759 [Xylariales sp. PMI_506]